MGATTRTGNIGIGFRRGWSDWQKDLAQVISFAQQEHFNCIDLGRDGDSCAAQVLDAGMQIGSVDLKEWGEMIHEDESVRNTSVASNTAYIEACAKHGVRNFFLVTIPNDASLGYEKNCEFMIDSFCQLVPVLEEHRARLVIEGYPAPGTPVVAPESYRSFFEATDSESVGINYDPSHLIRMGIDPIRFAREFVDRIYHIHGKDTEIFPENIYEAGYEHPAVQVPGHGFGKTAWRYSIPGHGEMRWVELFKILQANGFTGNISIELEDENFNGSEAGEKAGLIHGRNFLQSC